MLTHDHHKRMRFATATLAGAIAAAALAAPGTALAGGACSTGCRSMPGGPPSTPNPPSSSEQCKDGGWQGYTDAEGFAFLNQGDCISYLASGGESDQAGDQSPQFPGNPG
jgi:hypothetical protein